MPKKIARHEIHPQSDRAVRLQKHQQGEGGHNHPNFLDYEILLGDRAIGQATLALDRPAGVVTIEWLYIEEEERGKGYGKQARANLVEHILRTQRWVRTITSVIPEVPALKAAIATLIPTGWERTFEISEKTQDGLDYVPIRETQDPREALDSLWSGGSVRVNMFRSG